MSRNNRLIDLVFNNIIANQGKISAMEKFLSTDESLGIEETEEIKQYKESYEKLVAQISHQIELLSHIEELIVQLRCVEMIHDEIKFSLVREYIYARTLFYRSGKEIKDIRVIVGRIDDFDKSYDDIIIDPDFITMAELKLKETMLKEIHDLKEHTDEIENLIEWESE